MDDATFYGAVAEELERGLVRRDLWEHALSEAGGDVPAAHERYVQLCAGHLRQELADTAAQQPPEPVEGVTQPEPEAAGLQPLALQEQARAASVAPPWTPHYRSGGLARLTVLTLVLSGAALLGALGLVVTGFEGPGLILGFLGLVLLVLGLSRVGRSRGYRGPIL